MATLPKLPDFTTETYVKNNKTLKKRVYSNNSPIGQIITELKQYERQIAELQERVDAIKEALLVPCQRYNLARIENKAGLGLNRMSKTKWRHPKDVHRAIMEAKQLAETSQQNGKSHGETRFYLS